VTLDRWPEIAAVLAGQSDGCVVCADCLEVMTEMPEGCVDAVVTDPPYGCSVVRGNGRLGSNTSRAGIPGRVYAEVIGDDRPFVPTPWLSFPEVVLWGANWFCSRLPDASRWLVWDKRDGTASNNMADCELAWTNLPGPVRIFSHRWMGMIRASEKLRTDRVHPTQKPLALMEWCLSFVASSLVLDPFCGSGTTCVAAKKLGRRYIGIDISEDYCRIARARIAATPKPLFPPEPAETQAGLFETKEGVK